MSALLAAANRGELDVAVPEIVLREVSRAYERAVEEAANKNREVARDLDRLGIDWPHAPDRADVIAYDTWLRELLTAHAVQVLPFPPDNHESLVARDLEGRKPFGHNGRGYRDALIWLTVLEAARERPVYLVSQNAKDFAAGRDQRDVLHEDLKADLHDRHFDADQVRLFPRPGDLMTHFAGLRLDVVEALNAAFEARTALRQKLVALLEVALLEAGTDEIDVQLPGFIDEILLEVVHEPVRIIAETASPTGPDTCLLDLYIEADIDVHVSAMVEDDDPWDGHRRHRKSVSTTETLWFTAECTYEREAANFRGVTIYGSAHGQIRSS